MKLLVTGATGNIGTLLIPRLANHHDIEIRAFVRDEAKAKPLQAAGASLVVGAFEDETAVQQAVADIDTVVLITSPNENAAKQANAVLAAAKQANVRKIVRISVTKAALDGPSDNVRQHGRVDNEIQASGLTYVILRPHFFMQNIFMAAESIANDGNMYWGMGDGKLGLIDVRDIVDCIENVVLSNEHDNRIYTLTGPESISFHAIAARLGQALNRTINYIPVPLDAVEQSLLDMGMGDWFARVFRDYSDAYSQNWGDLVTNDVQKITGHPARSIDAFGSEVLAHAFQTQTA